MNLTYPIIYIAGLITGLLLNKIMSEMKGGNNNNGKPQFSENDE